MGRIFGSKDLLLIGSLSEVSTERAVSLELIWCLRSFSDHSSLLDLQLGTRCAKHLHVRIDRVACVEIKARSRWLCNLRKGLLVRFEVASVVLASAGSVMLAILVLEEHSGRVLLSLVRMRSVAIEVVEVSAHSLHVGHLLIGVHASVAAEVLPRIGLQVVDACAS